MKKIKNSPAGRRPDSKQTVSAEELFERGQYQKLFDLALKTPDSRCAVELGLKAALEVGRGGLVLQFYSLLKKNFLTTASRYSEDVLPYVRFANRNAVAPRTLYAPGTEMWGIPARLSTPLYKKIV